MVACHSLASIPESSSFARGETVRIGGERKAKRKKDVDFHSKEISCGSCERIFTLPNGVETDKLN